MSTGGSAAKLREPRFWTERVRRVKVLTIASRYSILNAFMGEMDAARLAGIMAAKKAQMAALVQAQADGEIS